MSVHRPVCAGVFQNPAGAEDAVRRLVEAGFAREEISVICPTCDDEQFAGAHRVERSGSHTPAAAAVGGGVGGALGGLVFGTVALATGGAGLLVAGPLLGILGGGLAGGFIGAMMTRGLEPEIADFYDQAVQRGQVLVAAEQREDGTGPDRAAAERALTAAGADALKMVEG